MPFLSWDGNKSYIDTAIAFIDSGALEDAYLFLQEVRADIAPGTQPIQRRDKGAEGFVNHPEMQNYRLLEDGFRAVVRLLPREPIAARAKLLELKSEFGWNTPPGERAQ